MLYSHQHKFIFIKTMKTAGTTLEICLSRHMHDARDIIAPIAPEDEKIRAAEGIFARNHMGPEGFEVPVTERPYYWNHMHAQEIRAKLTPPVWDSCIKVTSERHPYEKAVSAAYFYGYQRGITDFGQCLDEVIGKGNLTNMDWYSLDGKIIADVILRYEYLLEDTNRFLESLALPPLPELPKAKTRYRLDKRPAAEILSPEYKQKIQAQCAREFEYFGYEP